MMRHRWGKNRMTTKTKSNAIVHPDNHPVSFEDPSRLLPRRITKLYGNWMILTYAFNSKGNNLSGANLTSDDSLSSKTDEACIVRDVGTLSNEDRVGLKI
jgi:hypothetical protein